MAEEEPKKVTLKTSDSAIFEVEPSIVKQMQTVRNCLESDGVSSSMIPLPNVSGKELAKIIEYLRQHAVEADHKEFDERFAKMLSPDEKKELFLAANYLNVASLFDFMSQCIADYIENKSVEFVRGFFGIVGDYTPEEEAKLREENAWAYEGVDDTN